MASCRRGRQVPLRRNDRWLGRDCGWFVYFGDAKDRISFGSVFGVACVCRCADGRAGCVGLVSCGAVGKAIGWAIVVAAVERSVGGAADADRRYAEEPDGVWRDGGWMEAG